MPLTLARLAAAAASVDAAMNNIPRTDRFDDDEEDMAEFVDALQEGGLVTPMGSPIRGAATAQRPASPPPLVRKSSLHTREISMTSEARPPKEKSAPAAEPAKPSKSKGKKRAAGKAADDTAGKPAGKPKRAKRTKRTGGSAAMATAIRDFDESLTRAGKVPPTTADITALTADCKSAADVADRFSRMTPAEHLTVFRSALRTAVPAPEEASIDPVILRLASL